MKSKFALFPLFLGGAMIFSASPKAEAATFDLSQYDYTQLENTPTAPFQSNNQLFLSGNPEENQGFTAFFNLDFSAPDVGHFEISKNSPGSITPYYTTGKHASPEEPATGATRSTSLTDTLGFANFSTYLNDNDIAFNQIGLSYGQRDDRDFTQTWNLGDNLLGQDWFASPDSTVEEGVYRANPEDVEIFLVYEDTKFIDFGYSDFYYVLDYGETLAIEDDFDAIFSDPFSASKSDNLSPLLSGLADAFLLDVESNGDSLQAVYEEDQPQELIATTGNGFGVASLPFPLTLRVVDSSVEDIPEPSMLFGLSLFSAWSIIRRRRMHSA